MRNEPESNPPKSRFLVRGSTALPMLRRAEVAIAVVVETSVVVTVGSIASTAGSFRQLAGKAPRALNRR